jgi:excisionase family DNA binding protein
MEEIAGLEIVPAGAALPPLLTVEEAATSLRLSRASVYRRIAAGELHAVRLGSQAGSAVRVPVSAVREFTRDYEKAGAT